MVAGSDNLGFTTTYAAAHLPSESLTVDFETDPLQ